MSTPNYIFMDIDMTLWDEYLNIPQSTIEAIHLAQKKGNKVFINTGRSRSNTHYKPLSDIGFDGIICACGAHIEEDGKILSEVVLPWEVVDKAMKTFKKYHMPVVVEGRDFNYLNKGDFSDDPYVIALWDHLGDYARPLSAIDEKSKINKFSADITDITDFPKVQEALKKDMHFIFHNSTIIEMCPNGVSKASGMKWLLEKDNIPLENSYAFGDGMNDYEMIQAAGHGIVMGNGNPNLKKVADYITTDIHDDGIYNAFREFGLI